MSRDAHAESVAIARAEIEALINRFRAAQEKLDETLGAVVLAVGDPPEAESGRIAFEYIASLADRIDEIIRTADNASSSLSNYANGF